MPYYPGLRSREFKDRRRFVCNKLVQLRQALQEKTPRKSLEGSLTVATWNLRDFGRVPEPGRDLNPEPRLPECFYYIAEVMNRFDIIAVQEVNENLDDFERLMRVLGHHFDYIFTDVTEGRGGNDERMVFVYDTRKVTFCKMAGEIVLPREEANGVQFARTPFVVSFQSAWLKFDICTSHLLYGSDSGPKKQLRVEEIRRLGDFMKKRADRTKTNTFILGDFNVVGPGDETWEALRSTGFTMPEPIAKLTTNAKGTKHYDQIAFYSTQAEVELATNPNSAGTLRLYDVVFDKESDYINVAKNPKPGKFEDWRTWQISDHMPLWVEIKTDFTERYLEKIAGPDAEGTGAGDD